MAKGVVAALLLLGGLVVWMWLGAKRVDAWLADADGPYAHVTVLGRDAGPGDEIGFHVIARGTTITAAHAQIGAARFDAADTGWDDVRFSARLPADAGETVQVVVKVELAVEASVFSRTQTIDTLPIALALGRPRALDLGLAALAWLAAAGLAYALVRWRPIDREVAAGAANLVGRLALLTIALLGVAGQLAFVRPIQRTTPSIAELLPILLILAWGGALVLGGLLGHRARLRDLAWWKAWLRPVIGTPPLTDAFRGAGSTLPPSLSRDVDPAPLDRVRAALVAAGFTVDGRLVSRGGEVIARLGTRAAAARPEELGLALMEPHDGTPLAQALTAVYGPLEIRSRFTPATIVNPVGSAAEEVRDALR